jgi:ribosome biogenesis protein MAK21
MQELSRDTLMHVRNNMVTCLHDLLAYKPEQEQNLLKLLVNKLGDSDNKVAAKTSQLLIELLVKHPGMKMFVIRELEQLLLRPSTSEKAQYYSIITMNQTILTSKDTAVANKLIELYFTFFRKLLKIVEDEEKDELKNKKKLDEVSEEAEEENGKPKKKSKKQETKDKAKAKKDMELEDHQSKMIAAILTGVNRAFHFADISDEM